MDSYIAHNWDDYALLWTGNGERVERFGAHTVRRPDPNVLWSGGESPAADLLFSTEKEQPWQGLTDQLAEGWELGWQGMRLLVKPTSYRHLGLFPEQAANWSWIDQLVRQAGRPVRVLNLFAYTGASTIVAALAGAHVTHVDAAKGTVYWASENAKRSGVAEDRVRWIVDDARKFLKRESRRGNSYDLILLDPPVFGRGSKGEVWRLEEDLGPLLELCREVLSDTPAGFLLNTYATEMYPHSFLRLVQDTMGPAFASYNLATLSLEEQESKRLLQTGYCIRT